MHHSSIPEKPLTIGADGKVEDAQRVYFFLRSDGKRIYTQGQEAWNLYSRRQQSLGRVAPTFKLVGSSDGSLYRQAVIEAQQIFRETGDMSQARARLLKGENDEFEIAKNNLTPPPNFDKKGNGANFIQA